MRPIPIPDECIPEGCKRYVVAPPSGDLLDEDVSPVEVVAGITEGLGVGQCVLIALEEGELERLAQRERPAIWLTMYTNQLPVFAIEIADGQG